MTDPALTPEDARKGPESQPASPKKTYELPELTCYGAIVEIVRGPSKGAFDAFVGDPGGFVGS